MASPPSSPVSLPPPPPRPSAYIQSWLAKGAGPGGDKAAPAPAPTVGSLEAELASLGDPSAAKTATKDLLQRVLPRLAAHDVPTPASLKTLSGMLVEGASADRFVVRYAHYFTQRLLERYGCAAFTAGVPEGRGLIDRLSEDLSKTHAKHGARAVLAARALVAGARSGIPEARMAATAALRARRRRAAAGTSRGTERGVPNPSSGPPRTKAWTPVRELRSARACAWATRARPREARKVCCRRKPSRRALGPRTPSPPGTRGPARSRSRRNRNTRRRKRRTRPRSRRRRARARARAVRVGDGPGGRHGGQEARLGGNRGGARGKKPRRRRQGARAAEKDAAAKFPSAPRFASTAIAALAMRACGALAARLAADAADPDVPGRSARARLRQRPRAPRANSASLGRRRRGGARGGSGPRTAARRGAPAPALPPPSVFSTARVALAAVAGAFAGDAPRGRATRAARARRRLGTRRRSRARTAARWTCWSPRRGS